MGVTSASKMTLRPLLSCTDVLAGGLLIHATTWCSFVFKRRRE